MTNFISINTDLPGPRSKEMAKEREKYVTYAFGKDSLSPCYIAEGEGALVTDVDGNTFIDFTGGWGCLSVGHTAKRVVKSVKDQAEKYMHTDFSNIPYEPYVKLAKRLTELAPGNNSKKVAFFNSGAEAVENAVKIARAYTGRKAVVVFENAFHGRTLLTMTMTHKANPYKYKFGPFASDVYRLPYPNPYRSELKLENFERELTTRVEPEEVAALVIEPVQGEGGFLAPPDGFLKLLDKLCRKYGIIFVVDEIQSGMGRTGKIFASEHWNIEPDLITVGKSLAAGLPLSGVIGKEEVMDSLPGGSIGGTYCGNPVACRAGIEVLNIIEERDLLERAVEIGQRVEQRFLEMRERYEVIGDVRGIGAMMGIEFVKDRETKNPAAEITSEVVKECVNNGLLVPSCGIYNNVIRLLLPLVTTDPQLEEGLDVLERSIASVTKSRS